MAAGEIAETEAEALERAIGRTFRWHYLLRGGKLEVLSEEAQKGLIGEIEVLKLLIAALGAKPALSAWTGPSGAPKDFELKADCIEVKARRGASQPFVKITSEHQLADVPDRRLWLGVLAVDKVAAAPRPDTDGVCGRGDGPARADANPLPSWTGTCIWPTRATMRCTTIPPGAGSSQPPEFHAVAEGFPRIAAPVPLGVAGVTYALALSACAPFRTDWEQVRVGALLKRTRR